MTEANGVYRYKFADGSEIIETTELRLGEISAPAEDLLKAEFSKIIRSK